MNIVITARKTTVKDSFKERVEKKLAKFDRFFDDASATVVVTNERDRETVEITIQSMGMFFRAEKTTGDRIDSLESVTDSLMKQIIRNKSKLQKKFRSPAFVEPVADEPLYEEENLLGHTFFMFRNADSGEINVVYSRRNGDYGLLVPETE